MIERWLPVTGYEGLYEVSDLGRVRSLDRVVAAKAGSTAVRKGRIMQPRPNKQGYWRIHLRKDGAYGYFFVYQLVAREFVGERPEGWDIDHINANLRDDRAANLRYLERRVHRRLSSQTKLTDDQVVEIFDRVRQGERNKDLATEFGVSRQLVGDIKSGRTRADITMGEPDARKKA